MPPSPLTRVADAARALLGISAYTQQGPQYATVDEDSAARIRKALGGQLQPLPQTPTRLYLSDIETATRMADGGDLSKIGQLWRAMRRDGMLGGLLKTRTAGLVALPMRWRGSQEIIEALTTDNATRTVFSEMFPATELALLAADGIGCGVGIAELVPVVGRDYPVMVRLDPEFLLYRWNEGRWYYRSVAGLLPVTPGDGRWILHTPGGRQNPWQFGAWPALARAAITKEHAMLARGNFAAKLANPARVAYAPAAATEAQRLGFLARLIAWGVNSVFELPPGWEAKLLESNGRGWEVFGTEIETANLEIMIALAGQVVTVTGGTGFANADIHQTIRADLIKETAEALAHTINTQGLPQYVVTHHGVEALEESVRVEWDIKPPIDQMQAAEAMTKTAEAITAMVAALAAAGIVLDVREIINRFGVPVVEGAKPPEPTTTEDADEETEDDADSTEEPDS